MTTTTTEGKTRVFVYGSLLRGLGNHGFLRTAIYDGEGLTAKPFGMFDLGSFPGVAPADKAHEPCTVRGECYLVDDETLERLHRLEGHPTFYKATETSINMLDEPGTKQAFIYVLQGPILRDREAEVPHCDWRAFCIEHKPRLVNDVWKRNKPAGVE